MSSAMRERSSSAPPVPRYVPWLNFLGIHVPKATTCTVVAARKPTKRGRSPSPQHDSDHDLVQHGGPAKRRKIDQASSTCEYTGSEDAARDQATPTQPSDSPFLSIPGELRNEIYRYTLCAVSHDTTLEVTTVKYHTHNKKRLRSKCRLSIPCNLALGLLRTSRTIHEEAAPILYGENKIQFSYVILLAWNIQISNMRPHVRRLSISDLEHVLAKDVPSDAYWLNQLLDFRNLERVELYLDLNQRAGNDTLLDWADSRSIGRNLYWNAFHPPKSDGKSTAYMLAALDRIQIFLEPPQADSETIREEVAYFISDFHVEKRKLLEDYVDDFDMEEDQFLEAVERRSQCLEKNDTASSGGKQG